MAHSVQLENGKISIGLDENKYNFLTPGIIFL
jgi:hypothetical protein